MTVTFFGHRDTPSAIAQKIASVIEELIASGASDFYVGNQGNFDALVRKALKEAKIRHPHIRYSVVLAYLPKAGDTQEEYEDTVYPDGMESVPPRFAISRRNRWMLTNADTVVVYVSTCTGGASKWKDTAEKQGKRVINLA